jgi:hypothetical protein
MADGSKRNHDDSGFGRLDRCYDGRDARRGAGLLAQKPHVNEIIDLWARGKPAFGVYAPNEHPGPRGQGPRPAVYTRGRGEKLAIEGSYDACWRRQGV